MRTPTQNPHGAVAWERRATYEQRVSHSEDEFCNLSRPFLFYVPSRYFYLNEESLRSAQEGTAATGPRTTSLLPQKIMGRSRPPPGSTRGSHPDPLPPPPPPAVPEQCHANNPKVISCLSVRSPLEPSSLRGKTKTTSRHVHLESSRRGNNLGATQNEEHISREHFKNKCAALQTKPAFAGSGSSQGTWPGAQEQTSRRWDFQELQISAPARSHATTSQRDAAPHTPLGPQQAINPVRNEDLAGRK